MPRTPLHVRFSFFVCVLVFLGSACQPEKKRAAGVPDSGVQGDGGVLCGNGKLDTGEQCDDGNARSLDGCSSSCRIEPGFACSTVNAPCTFSPSCGDGFLESGEACDDANHVSGDGCSSACQLEAGWVCTEEGAPCKAAACGDGLIAGTEECDDHNNVSGDGCTADCHLEKNFKCDTAGAPCTVAVCGNGVREGLEQCDDGNNDMGDGCAPDCTREPHCVSGVCDVVCGDGVLLPSEQGDPNACDDGNLRNGDGCSSTCRREKDFSCDYALIPSPDNFIAPIVYRDFCGDHDDTVKCGGSISHPDFQHYSGSVPTVGLVKDTLDAEGKPAFLSTIGPPGHAQELTDEPNFKTWYRDSPQSKTKVDTLVLPRQMDGSYVFDTTAFFPLDGFGWPTLGLEPLKSAGSTNHNFSFTSEVRYWFEYKGTEVLSFRGDDDVWVFINRKLVMDLGGLHPPAAGTVNLASQASALGLTVGGIYETVVWQAERHTQGSNYRLTLNNFETRHSLCKSMCGNGVVDAAEGEECDDGNNVSGDGCSATCHGELN